MSRATDGSIRESFHVGVVKGQEKLASSTLSLRYKEKTLAGKALEAQLTSWEQLGVLEADTAASIRRVAQNSEALNLSGHTFVLIGAGSAMGPFSQLLEWGATVVALDIPGNWGIGGQRPSSGLWKRLISTARSSPGTLIFPLSKPQKACGSDLELWQSCGCDLTKQPAAILLRRRRFGG